MTLLKEKGGEGSFDPNYYIIGSYGAKNALRLESLIMKYTALKPVSQRFSLTGVFMVVEVTNDKW